MKSTSQIYRDSLGIKFAALIVALAFTRGAIAQEKIQPETELQLPAQQVKQIDKNNLDKEEAEQNDKAGAVTPSSIDENKAISPSDLKQNEAVSPSDLQDSDKLPAVQKDKLPAVQNKPELPAVQEKQPLSGGMEIDRIIPAQGAPGTRVRIQGRNFGPSAGDRGLYISTADERSALEMDVRIWNNNEIVAIIPNAATGNQNIYIISRTGGPILSAKRFRVLEGSTSPFANKDVLPEDAGKPDTGGIGDGGFVPSTGGMSPELDFYKRPSVRSLDTGYSAAAGLAYGKDYEITFGVQNRSETDSTTFRPAFDLGKDGTGQTFPAHTLGPAESKEISMRFNLASLGEGVKRTALEDSPLTLRIYLAKEEPTGYGFSGWHYRDAHVSNHVTSREYDVLHNIKLMVQLNRLTQYGLCRDWAQSRDWQFLIYLLDSDYKTRRIDKPPFRDGAVRASHRISPTIEYEYEIDSSSGNITTTPMLFALKDNGRVKNSGHSAGFNIIESLDDLKARAISGRAWKTVTVRSVDRGGAFCGNNLELEAKIRVAIEPYSR